MIDQTKTMIITKAEYEDLKDTEKLYLALAGAGVDNWSGYDFAMELYRNGEE